MIKAMDVANIVEFTWLSGYPQPTEINVYWGKEFIGHDFQTELCKKEYGLKVTMATTANPQANSVLERIHQILSNMVHTRGLEESEDL